MAIASVRETDRGSIGGSLEKLCDDGLMKSGSDMSQSHWLRVVECQGWNRAGASRSVRDALCTEYVSARRREHGPGQTGISVCTAAQWAFVLSGVATHSSPPFLGKTGAGGGRDRPLLLPPFTRVQLYIGRDLCWQAQLAHRGTYIPVLYCTAATGQVSNMARGGVGR